MHQSEVERIVAKFVKNYLLDMRHQRDARDSHLRTTQRYAAKLNGLLRTEKKQFFHMDRDIFVEEICEPGEILLLEFNLTPPMQALMNERWLVDDEYVRHMRKYLLAKSTVYLEYANRMKYRSDLIHQLFLAQVRTISSCKDFMHLFSRKDTSLHYASDWTCYVAGPRRLAKQ